MNSNLHRRLIEDKYKPAHLTKSTMRRGCKLLAILNTQGVIGFHQFQIGCWSTGRTEFHRKFRYTQITNAESAFSFTKIKWPLHLKVKTSQGRNKGWLMRTMNNNRAGNNFVDVSKFTGFVCYRIYNSNFGYSFEEPIITTWTENVVVSWKIRTKTYCTYIHTVSPLPSIITQIWWVIKLFAYKRITLLTDAYKYITVQ